MLLGRGEEHGEEERDEEEERPLTGVTLGGDQQELLRARHAHRPEGNSNTYSSSVTATNTNTAAESKSNLDTFGFKSNTATCRRTCFGRESGCR